MLSDTNVKTVNFNSIYPAKTQKAFRAQTYPARDYPADTVEIKENKKNKEKKLSTTAKVGIGAGVVLAGVIIGIAVLSKQLPKTIEKLYKEKLIPKVFDKELTFKEATSKEEAIKYAKEVLGVDKIDDSITLEALNYTNKGITKVVNKNIGRELFIPRRYAYVDAEDRNYIACVNSNILSKHFGELRLNRQYFDEEFLTGRLIEYYYKDSRESRVFDVLFNDYAGHHLHLVPMTDSNKNIKELIKKFINNPNSITKEEKRELFFASDIVSVVNSRASFNYEEFLKSKGIKLDLSQCKNSIDTIATIDQYCKDKKITLECPIVLTCNPDTVIYHEMGHLQDFAKNLKNIELKYWNKQKLSELKVDEFGDRWSGTTYGNMEEFFKNNPQKFKAKFPNLYEFLTNEESQKAARKVSGYASTSIGEFIADTYAKMINGDKISDDVMALYKKYNGPMIN